MAVPHPLCAQTTNGRNTQYCSVHDRGDDQCWEFCLIQFVKFINKFTPKFCFTRCVFSPCWDYFFLALRLVTLRFKDWFDSVGACFAPVCVRTHTPRLNLAHFKKQKRNICCSFLYSTLLNPKCNRLQPKRTPSEIMKLFTCKNSCVLNFLFLAKCWNWTVDEVFNGDLTITRQHMVLHLHRFNKRISRACHFTRRKWIRNEIIFSVPAVRQNPKGQNQTRA